jgi:hypothetical protein
VIRDFQASLATGVEREQIAKNMQQLCAEFDAQAEWREAGYLALGYDQIHSAVLQ